MFGETDKVTCAHYLLIRPDLSGKRDYHAVLPGSSMIGKILRWLQERIKHWTKPATSILIIGAVSDLTCSHADLVVENALLRQQLIVLNRQIKRPQLTNLDRFHLVVLSHFTKFWKQAIHIVQPDTLLRWHRELFGMYWRKKSQGKPKITAETIALIENICGDGTKNAADRPYWCNEISNR